MTTYIALFNLTDAGIKAAKDSPRRLDAASATRTGAGVVVYSAEYEPPEQLIRGFTTVARPVQEGLAFRSKGSIGVAGRRRAERA